MVDVSLAGSVSAVLDEINDAHYANRPLSKQWKAAAAKFIATRQGLPGSYSDAFAGIGPEVAELRLYTGEQVTSASARHLLGEECCRAMRLLDVAAERAALERAEAGLQEALSRGPANRANPGVFCCGKCTVGLWRNLLAGGMDRQEERLTMGVRHLKSLRDGKGGWIRFPYWYTVLALAEINHPAAKEEIRYASSRIVRVSRKSVWKDDVERRRQELARRCIEGQPGLGGSGK